MSQKFKIIDFDIIFLSYDEPNAEKNYADLCNKAPWAKRVHGVKGSDAAHKACARLSETDRFITVDADNIVHPEFFNQELDFEANKDLSKCVISWCGYNTVNGLMYGNGGLKLWPKQYVLDMKTHEAAPADNPNAQVDFCWDAEYIQMNSCFSDVYNNATPFQAWRAGFREGVKMSLDRGIKVDKSEFQKRIHWKNLHRLLTWCNVGVDSPNGLWAIIGAREGCYQTNCTDWDYVQVRDFEYLTEYWKKEYEIRASEDTAKLTDYARYLGNCLRAELGLDMALLDADASKFFKKVHVDQTRIEANVLDKE
jgi:hypothetical protein